MYCISQETGAPVVVYKDSQNIQQTINVPPWSGATIGMNHDSIYNGTHQQHKEIQQVNIPTSSSVANQNQQSIRVETGNQVNKLNLVKKSFSSLFYFRRQQFKFLRFQFRHSQTSHTLLNQVLIMPQHNRLFKRQVTSMPFPISNKRNQELNLCKITKRKAISNSSKTSIKIKLKIEVKKGKTFIARYVKSRFG